MKGSDPAFLQSYNPGKMEEDNVCVSIIFIIAYRALRESFLIYIAGSFIVVSSLGIILVLVN